MSDAEAMSAVDRRLKCLCEASREVSWGCKVLAFVHRHSNVKHKARSQPHDTFYSQ